MLPMSATIAIVITMETRANPMGINAATTAPKSTKQDEERYGDADTLALHQV